MSPFTHHRFSGRRKLLLSLLLLVASLAARVSAFATPSRPAAAAAANNNKTPRRTWDENLQALTTYKECFGDCNVPRSFKEDTKLRNWVKTQRQIKSKLSQEQRDALDAIGFDWDPLMTAWNEMYKKLKEYRKKHGDCNVPQSFQEDSGLAGWVARQRAIKSKLSQEQREALDAIGFDWDRLMTAWNEMYKKLKEYKDTNGDCYVPQNHTDATLHTWVKYQRRSQERLTEHQRNALNEIGFDWDPHETEWCTMYERLVVYKETHGHCRVPRNYTEDLPLVPTETDDDFRVPQNYTEDQLLGHLVRTQTPGDCCYSQNYTDCKGKLLGLWVRTQRDLKRQDKLDPSREQRLNALQFTWSKPRKPSVCKSDEDWDEMYQELVAFKEKHGHINVGKVCNKLAYLLSHDRWFHSLLLRKKVLKGMLKKRKTLADWIQAQRKNGLCMGKKRREALNALGFEWLFWHVQYWKLGAFKAVHGHCNVPRTYQDTQLARWVAYQRKNKKRQLEQYPKRQRRLELLKFDWVPQETAWQKMFARLKTYQKQYGNCNVPDKYSVDSALGIWVSDQRLERLKAKLSDVRRDALDSIGFEWDPIEADWQNMFQQLEAYKTTHGDCNVPARYTADRELGAWVCKQRRMRHEMSPERRQRLESIGFDWDPLETAWIHKYEKLVVYQKREGHCRVPQSDPQLGNWVNRQRQRKASGKMDPRHEQLLDEIGFVWSATKSTSKRDNAQENNSSS